MAYDPTIKRYAKDLGVPVPNVEFCPTEFPRLHSFPAPYLPLGLANERHDEHFVVLTGKVVALDSLGFLVPAGLALQIELATAANVATDKWSDGTYTRYTAKDITAGVKNARGVTAQLDEPVVSALVTDAAFAGVGGDVPVANSAITIGDHIGIASYSWMRASSDILDRANIVPASPSDLRHMAWEPQLASKTVRTNYCLEYPVTANRTNIKIDGQAVAIGAIANYKLGARVSYDVNSDIALEAALTDVGVVFSQEGLNAVMAELDLRRRRCVGQVIKQNTRVPSSALDKVRSKWEAAGFEDIDKMPGSATAGKPWNLHTAGASESIVISTFMR
jgi:hypothetical protein